MAKFNEILVGRYNRYLQKLLGIKGGPPAAQLATEISTAIGLFHGVENRALEGWYRFAGVIQPVAIAAGTGAVQIRLSGATIAVLERISLNATAGGGFNLTQGAATDLTNLFTGFRLDNRVNQRSSAILSGTAGIAATDLAVTQQIVFAAGLNQDRDVIITHNQEWPLFPGDALRFRFTVVNTAFTVNLIWRERALEESELTL